MNGFLFSSKISKRNHVKSNYKHEFTILMSSSVVKKINEINENKIQTERLSSSSFYSELMQMRTLKGQERPEISQIGNLSLH